MLSASKMRQIGNIRRSMWPATTHNRWFLVFYFLRIALVEILPFNSSHFFANSKRQKQYSLFALPFSHRLQLILMTSSRRATGCETLQNRISTVRRRRRLQLPWQRRYAGQSGTVLNKISQSTDQHYGSLSYEYSYESLSSLAPNMNIHDQSRSCPTRTVLSINQNP